ncbi:MAG TPA: hypothetical protein VGV86_10740 [Acidimicrobiales bacterium]|nr:hypothetical protein [Acidimicrobiales bacterium]
MSDRQPDTSLRARASRLRLLPLASLLLVMTIAATTLVPLQLDDEAEWLLLRILAIVTLSFLPGWLFLRFVTVRASSVWDEYVLNLHRLGIDRTEHLPEPPANSLYHARWLTAGGAELADRPNIYRDKFEAHYGNGTARDQGCVSPAAPRGTGAQLRAETFLPVFLATAVFAAGWAAVLLRPSLFVSTGVERSTADVLRLGFMGAYLFTLQMLVRRYFQADLKASAYVNAVTRVASALVLVLVVHLAMPSKTSSEVTVAVAFIIGFFPLVGLQALQKAAALALRTVVPSLRNSYPLSDLDGLSVWYEARLLELGIEDMQNLATANLVDVTLHSRVPVSRLVDWVDQAHLCLHLAPQGGDGSDRKMLRRLGIRSATALEEAFTPTDDGLLTAADDERLLGDLRWALNADGTGPSVTLTLLKTLRSDPNLTHVRCWKQDWDQPTSEPTVPVATSAPESGAVTGSVGAPLNGGTLRRALAPLASLAFHRG